MQYKSFINQKASNQVLFLLYLFTYETNGYSHAVFWRAFPFVRKKSKIQSMVSQIIIISSSEADDFLLIFNIF